MKKIFHRIACSLVLLFFVCSSALAVNFYPSYSYGNDSLRDLPFGTYYKNSTTQMIYTKKELGLPSSVTNITIMGFEVHKIGKLSNQNVKIYMGNTTKDQFSSPSDAVNVSSLTEVFDGVLTLGAQEGWEYIDFSTPFTYDGSSNVVIVIARTSSSFSSNLYYVAQSSTNTGLYRRSDGNADYGDATNTTISYTLFSKKPIIKLANTTPSLSAGVYQISDVYELRWFANKVNTGSTTLKAKLTKNIYISDMSYMPIGTSTNPFAGTFDGANYTLQFYNSIFSTASYNGIFGYIAGAGIVKNVAMSMSSTSLSAGSYAGL